MAAKNPTDVGNDGPIAELPEQTWDEVMVEGDADKIRDRLQGELSALLKRWSRRLQHADHEQPRKPHAGLLDDVGEPGRQGRTRHQHGLWQHRERIHQVPHSPPRYRRHQLGPL